MHLVLLHGYLLTGTGSNIYVANVARAWATQGHAVTVVCQEPEAASLAFVNDPSAASRALDLGPWWSAGDEHRRSPSPPAHPPERAG